MYIKVQSYRAETTFIDCFLLLTYLFFKSGFILGKFVQKEQSTEFYNTLMEKMSFISRTNINTRADKRTNKTCLK